ncbi:hypothetical protein U9M48_003913 [Paspalum notatum var. saurae]|uniref:Cationic amino acid transporter C-terminal domain-containing protein n=1 Tax=Paspalum notatum var. saurae TaxID=547442 RepID=A0AAQ3SED4_PASNO
MAPVDTPAPPHHPADGGKQQEAPGPAARGYWRWRKDDFFPEPTFASWAAYRAALGATPARLRDRLAGRSTDAAELGALRRCLTWWDLTWFGFGSVIGAGIFVLTGQEAHDHAGPAIVLSYAASGFSAMLSVFCYTEFAVEIPVAGGSFAYIRVELGDAAAFIAAANLILETIIGKAAVTRSWTSYLASLLNRPASALRIHTSALPEGYNGLDPIAVAVVAGTSRVNWVASAVHVLVIAFVIVAGFLHANPSNLTPFAPYGAPGVFRAAAVVYFRVRRLRQHRHLGGGDQEPVQGHPAGPAGVHVRHHGHLLRHGAGAEHDAAVHGHRPQRRLLRRVPRRRDAVGAVRRGLVAIGALKGMTTVLLVGLLGKARYTTHIARSHIIPPVFALVHPRTGTPVHATALVAAATACFALFSSLKVLSTLLSISTLFIFMMMATALPVRRYYVRGVTRDDADARAAAHRAAAAHHWLVGRHRRRWHGYVVLVPAWAAGTLGIQLLVPAARAPKVWGVPMVPWMPSLSIATNIFLMGSLGKDAFIRFGFCTAVMIIYYVLVGLHATYDVAHGACGRDEEDEGTGS